MMLATKQGKTALVQLTNVVASNDPLFLIGRRSERKHQKKLIAIPANINNNPPTPVLIVKDLWTFVSRRLFQGLAVVSESATTGTLVI